MINSTTTFSGWRISKDDGRFVVARDEEQYEFQTEFAASCFLNIARKCDLNTCLYSTLEGRIPLSTIDASSGFNVYFDDIMTFENGQLVYVDLPKILWVGIRGPKLLKYLKRFWYGEKYAD